jgi:hypothetical protein
MFSPVERNYGTYKRGLRAIIYFVTKYSHMLSRPHLSTIWTDHKPITTFLTGILIKTSTSDG